jgi:hypothetical protein
MVRHTRPLLYSLSVVLGLKLEPLWPCFRVAANQYGQQADLGGFIMEAPQLLCGDVTCVLCCCCTPCISTPALLTLRLPVCLPCPPCTAFCCRDLQHNKLHQQLAPLAAALYYHAAFGGHSATGAASSSTAAAAGIGGPTEVGSCGSTGTASGSAAARGQRGKRRASNGQAAAAAGGGNSDEGDGFSSDEDILQLPRKRSRVLGPAGQLLLHLQADPER